MPRILLAACLLLLTALPALGEEKAAQKASGNPVFEGRYADPEAAVFGDRYWIYPTYSAPYEDQTFFDAFSSTDLVTWTKRPRVLAKDVTWARRAMWAPSVVEKAGRYNNNYYYYYYYNFFFFFFLLLRQRHPE